MYFRNGALGALLVVLALIATGIFGVLTNVNSETVLVDKATYVTDITGAFTSEKERSYVDYNPSANYNGYTSTNTNNYAVDFTESNVANNYPLTYTTGLISLSNVDISAWNLTPYPMVNHSITYNPYSERVTSMEYKVYDINSNPVLYCYWGYVTYQIATAQNYSDDSASFHIYKFSDMLSAIHDAYGQNIEEITMQVDIVRKYDDFSVGGQGTDGRNYWHNVTYYYPSNSLIFMPTTLIDNYTVNDGYYTNSLISSNSTIVLKMTYNSTTNLCTVTANNQTVYSVNVDDMLIGYTDYYRCMYYQTITLPSDLPNGGYSTNEVHKSTTHLMDVELHGTVNKKYIDVREGVGIRQGETVTWSNDYNNGSVGIIINQPSMSGSYQNTATLHYPNTLTTDSVTVSSTDGFCRVSVNGGTPVDIGTYRAFMVNIDASNHLVTTTPVSEINNLTDYTLSDITYDIGTLNGGTEISSISWTTTNQSFRIQVDRTDVFLKTYGVIMIDPQITLTNLWPNYPRMQLDFNKTAATGTSISFYNGGTVYAVTDGKITIDDEEYGLENYRLNYDYDDNTNNWNVTLTSNDTDNSYKWNNVGIPKITMGGTWYYNCGLSTVAATQESSYIWDYSNMGLDMGQIYLFMCGFLLLFGILMYRMGWMQSMDILITIVGMVILFVLLGGYYTS